MDEHGFRGTFTTAQTQQLLAPIKPERVLRDGKGNSHVSQQDVTAHLIRVFGFGNFSTEIVSVEPIFEEPVPEYVKNGKTISDRWTVCYRAHMRLTIYDEHHNFVTSYENVSCGDAQNLVRHEAHDLALKSAVSLAMKRCTINLGDQFGLSLYNKGQTAALVRGSIVLPERPEGEQQQRDITEGVPQQESLGHTEPTDGEPDAPSDEEAQAALAQGLGATPVTDPSTTEAQATDGTAKDVAEGQS